MIRRYGQKNIFLKLHVMNVCLNTERFKSKEFYVFFFFLWRNLSSPGLRCLIISSQNVKKNKQTNKKKSTSSVPFNTSEEIFHFGRTFLHFSTNTSARSYMVSVKTSSVAFTFICIFFKIFFSLNLYIRDNKSRALSTPPSGACWLNSENLPPGSETLF